MGRTNGGAAINGPRWTIEMSELNQQIQLGRN